MELDKHKNEVTEKIIVTKGWEDVVDKGFNFIGEVAEDYFDFQRQKEDYKHQIDKENVKTERLKITTTTILLAMCIIVAVVAYLIKDLPPALNSLICFIAGYAINMVGGKKKKDD
jgi:1,4-dihydroxy-2-naphthoate octaprenyltransferase